MRRFCVWMIALLLLNGLLPARAQNKAPAASSVKDQGLRATAMVVDAMTDYQMQGTLESMRIGSAFCISEQGYYITNAHVVERCPDNFPLHLWIWIGPGNAMNVEGIVVGRDKGLDLALLKVGSIPGLRALELGADAAPAPGLAVTAFGFPGGYAKSPRRPFERDDPRPPPNRLPPGLPPLPFPAPDGFPGNGLPPLPQLPPPVTMLEGRVTDLFGERKVLEAIEVDAHVKPGCSGGPLLNRKGQVIGVIRAVNRKTGRGLAIPVRVLKEFLARPTIALWMERPTLRVAATSIPLEQRSQEQPFLVSLRRPNGSPYRSLNGISAYLFLSPPGGRPERLVMTASGSAFTAPFVPLPSDTGTRFVTLTVRQDGRAAFIYRVQDQPVLVDGTATLLSRIAEITNGAAPTVTLVGGREQPGRVTGWERVGLPAEGLPEGVHLYAAQTISVTNLPSIPQAVDYRIQVTVGQYVVAENYGQIPIAGAPARKPQTGMVIVCADEWPTNNTGGMNDLSLTPSTRQYIRNLGNLFTGGAPGRFLICTDYWTFGPPFQEVLRAAGHGVTVARKPTTYDGYDGVFVGGRPVPLAPLIEYVKKGGRVYIAGGCNNDDSPLWNPFLKAFGLVMSADGRPDGWKVHPNAALPFFAGVTELVTNGVSKLDKLPGDWPDTYLTAPQFGVHFWAIYSPDKDVTGALSNSL